MTIPQRAYAARVPLTLIGPQCLIRALTLRDLSDGHLITLVVLHRVRPRHLPHPPAPPLRPL
jgi:hypothetical protein